MVSIIRVLAIHTGAGDFVLKSLTAHKDRAMLRYEHALLAWLDPTLVIPSAHPHARAVVTAW